MKIKFVLPGLMALALSGVGMGEAFASCDNLENNTEWNTQLSILSDAYKDGKYEDVIKIGQRMVAICSESPALNFYIAKSYTALNEPTKALRFYQKAADNTGKFAVSPEVAKQLWYTRYEVEFPELTQDYVNTLKKENESLNAQIETYEKNATKTVINQTEDSAERKTAIGAVLWTGVATGVVGLALLGTGIGMTISHKDDFGFSVNSSNTYKINNDKMYNTGLILLGVGAGLTIAGTIMTGIAGYQYTHIVMENNMTLSWDFTPSNVNFQLVF